MLLPVFLVPFVLLMAIVLVFILALFSALAGYLHLVSACFRCFSSMFQQFRIGADGVCSMLQ